MSDQSYPITSGVIVKTSTQAFLSAENNLLAALNKETKAVTKAIASNFTINTGFAMAA